MADAHETVELSLWKRSIFGLIFTVAPAILLILAIEAGGRAVIHIKHGVPGKSYGLWQYDAELGAIHAPNAYNSNAETNNLGFRNKEDTIEPRPAGALRIVAYGGSTTFCYNLSTDLAWPIRLQQLLRARRHSADQVLNGGAIMWSISHELARARRDLPKLKPDFVIIYSGVNEEANAHYLQAQGVDLEQALNDGKSGLFARGLDQERWLKRNSVAVRYWDYVAAGWLRNHVQVGRSPDANPVQSPSLRTFDPIVSRHFDATLREFIHLIRANGAKPIYVIVGGLPERDNNRRLLRYSRQGAEVARALDVPVLDSNEVIASYSGQRGELFAESGVHWSETGAELLASFIFKQAFEAK